MNNTKTTGGYVVIINTLIFMSLITVLVYGVINPIVSSYRSATAFSHSKESFILANSASEEALYRLKNSLPIANSEVLTLNNNTATITVADTNEGKVVSVQADVDSYQRDLEVSVLQGVGVSFNYGLQAGEGGFVLSGGAYINGNVYSNGDVLGNGGPYITGSATVANLIDPAEVVSVAGSLTPSTYIAFGSDNTPTDIAQSFTVPTDIDLSSVRVYLKKTTNNWMNNITVRITSNNSGKPSGTTLATGSIGASQVTTTYNYLTVPLSQSVSLNSGTTYWLVLDTSTTWGSQYWLAAGQSIYANGIAKVGTWASKNNDNVWNNTSPTGLDAYFDLYAGGDTGLISGVTVHKDAWAHSIEDSSVYGDAYCQSSSNTNKACDTSRIDPAPQPFPISDGNILDWKSTAEAGGVINNNVSYGSNNNVSLGPKKINGDLTVGGGATLTITGTLWVTGDVDVQGGGKIKLSSNYGNSSGIIVSDGQIKAGGGGHLEGSGISGSYILVATTSTCPIGCSGNKPAIDLSGGAGAVILNAQKGTLQISGGGQARQVTAKTIEMTGGASVIYETGIADMSFSSQPSGTWNIASWDEK